MLPKHGNAKTGDVIKRFMKQVQPEYPQKVSVEYKREGEGLHNAIPMPMADVFPDPIQLAQANVHADVIPMQS